jgi:hypothetical protein
VQKRRKFRKFRVNLKDLAGFDFSVKHMMANGFPMHGSCVFGSDDQMSEGCLPSSFCFFAARRVEHGFWMNLIANEC